MRCLLLLKTQGTFGPFVPAEETQVPLWLAAPLRQRGQCIIVPPKWLSLEHLEKVNNAQGRITSEQEAEQLRLPYRWREIAHRLLSVYVSSSNFLRLAYYPLSSTLLHTFGAG